MQKKREICEYRDKLDKTLSSPVLTNHDSLKSLLRNQLKECNENTLDKRTDEVSKLLSKLRSVSMTDHHDVTKLTNDGDWKFCFFLQLKHDLEDCRVMYREGLDGSPFHTMLVEGYMDGPIHECLCVSWETALYKKWWPQFSFPPFRILKSTCLQKIGVGEQICLARKDEDGIGMSSKDFVIPESPDAVRIDLVGGFVLQKVTPQRSYFRTIGEMDIKLDLMPPSLINFITRQLIGNGFRLYKKSVASVAKFDEDYSRALDDPLYTKIRQALYSTDKAIEEGPKLEATEVNGNSQPKKDQKNHGDATENKPVHYRKTVTEIEEEEDYEESVSSEDGNEITKTDVCMRRRFCVSPEVEQALGTLDRVIYMVRNITPVQEAEELSPDRSEDQANRVSLLENIISVPQRSQRQDHSTSTVTQEETSNGQEEDREKETGQEQGIVNKGKSSSLQRKRKARCFAFRSWL